MPDITILENSKSEFWRSDRTEIGRIMELGIVGRLREILFDSCRSIIPLDGSDKKDCHNVIVTSKHDYEKNSYSFTAHVMFRTRADVKCKVHSVNLENLELNDTCNVIYAFMMFTTMSICNGVDADAAAKFDDVYDRYIKKAYRDFRAYEQVESMRTPLEDAIMENDLDAVKNMVNDFPELMHWGNPLTHGVAYSGDKRYEIVQFLLDHDAAVKTGYGEVGPMTSAAYEYDYEMVTLLLKNGFNVDREAYDAAFSPFCGPCKDDDQKRKLEEVREIFKSEVPSFAELYDMENGKWKDGKIDK